MSWLYRNILRPVLFTQNAEDIHNRTMRARLCQPPRISMRGGGESGAKAAAVPTLRVVRGVFGNASAFGVRWL